ncbi:hypothetical protein ACFWFF_17985 [Streptomyces sp. NPDC060223]|uniref:hypothetical protein n=1 Tax=unclassified Streptomyces TaxID=2593676 RepID=UPI00364096D8
MRRVDSGQQRGEPVRGDREYSGGAVASLGNTPAGDKWRKILSFVSYFPGRGSVRETAYLEGKAEGKAEGEAEGEASLILRVLEKNGVPVPEGTHDRITSCTDLEVLTLWFDRALTATRADDLLTGESAEP